MTWESAVKSSSPTTVPAGNVVVVVVVVVLVVVCGSVVVVTVVVGASVVVWASVVAASALPSVPSVVRWNMLSSSDTAVTAGAGVVLLTTASDDEVHPAIARAPLAARSRSTGRFTGSV